MKPLGSLESNRIFVEIRPASFHAWTRLNGVDLRLERGSDGRLTAATCASATAALKGLVAGGGWLSRPRICCAIPSRGLLLRPISLPATAPGEVTRLLELKIEGEFPLPPDALAWGWLPLAAFTSAASTLSPARQEVLVAAVKKEVIDEYHLIVGAVDPDPIYTVAALARTALVPVGQRAYSVLDVGPTQSELTVVEDGVPPTVQLLPWGEKYFLEGLATRMGQSPEEAAKTLATLSTRPGSAADAALGVALKEMVEALAGRVPAEALARPVWISGPPAVAQALVQGWTGTHPAHVLPVPAQPGQTAAILGLDQSLSPRAGRDPLPILALRIKQMGAPGQTAGNFPVRQVALAAGLLLGVLLFPYIEALIFQPRLARRLAALKASQTNFVTIDRELSFLRYLELNQAPQLDAAFVIAQAAPPGARMNTLSLNRQGDLSLSGFIPNLAQIGEFRLKLINTGFFSTIVVEDQSPTPDRQRINFRLTGRWKSAPEREALTLGPALPETTPGKPGASNGLSVAKIPGGTNISAGTNNTLSANGLLVTNGPAGTNTASGSNSPATLRPAVPLAPSP